MKKHPQYFIENKDNPSVLWKYEEENEHIHPVLYAWSVFDNKWRMLFSAKDNYRALTTQDAFRRIPKKEAKSLFPEAFK